MEIDKILFNSNERQKGINKENQLEQFLKFDHDNINSNNIDRNYFQKINENIINIKYDFQGTHWDNNQRENLIKRRVNHHKGFRNIANISQEEIIQRTTFHLNKITDIFFQFRQYFTNLPIKYTHFQVRKNFIMPLDSQGKSNEIIYSKKYGIESFNLVTGKQQTLCMLGGDEESNYDKYTICMDVIKNNKGDYSLCTGRADGSVNLYYVSSSELNRVKEYKSNVVPKFDNYLSKVISQGNTDEILTNYVKFLKNYNKENLLLTTGNDGYVRIFDLQKNMNIVNEIKADHPVNNCDISNDGNILTCVGDSTNVEIFDLRTSKTCLKFNSHYDYGVVIKYLPENDYIFATGNQDFSCKIWDIRKIQVIGNNLNKMCSPVNHLSGYFESIGDLCFTKNKNFLIFAENADYLHIYNIKYQKIQTMTYISSFSGLAYDNDKERIYIGIEDDVTAGIICYDNINNNTLNSTNL